MVGTGMTAESIDGMEKTNGKIREMLKVQENNRNERQHPLNAPGTGQIMYMCGTIYTISSGAYQIVYRNRE